LRGILVDYSLLPVVGVLFLSSFLVTAAWRVVQAQTDERIEFLGGQSSLLWDAGALAIPSALSFLTFLFLYWLLPNLPVRLRDIWPGALVAGLGIELAKHGFALYLANFANYELVYGSLGGVIALLFWVYLSANILLFGAEIAAEVPHVLREEPRHGHADAAPADWRASLLTVLRGLVLVPEEEVGPAAAEHGEAPAESERR
jgi:membrane protein